MNRWGILLTITPGTLLQNEKKGISRKQFETFEEAGDFLAGNGYSRETGFWAKESEGQKKIANILELLA